MELVKHSEKIYELLVDCIKISKAKFSKEDVTLVLQTIDAINALPETAKKLAGNDFCDYEIPTGWRSLVYPKHFSFGGTTANPDVLSRPTRVNNELIASPEDHNEAVVRILGSMRNADSRISISRPEIQSFTSEKEYTIEGHYLKNEASLDRYDLDGAKVGSVLDIDSHVKDVTSKFCLLVAEGTWKTGSNNNI